MDTRAREVLGIGDAAFSRRQTLESLWQELALNFYPERADFTTRRNEGEEFADHLFSSYPVLARRELGNMLSEFLRPGKWFSIHVKDRRLDAGDAERIYLEELTEIQWAAMNDPRSNFVTATSQTDHDFATFGNGVIWVGLNSGRTGLLFLNFHLRDNAWSENADRIIDANHRNWCPTARQLVQTFHGKVSREVMKAYEKEPEKTFKCRHVVLPSRVYEYKTKGGKSFPFTELYVERETETVLRESGLKYFPYVIPRWQTVSGSAYGSSMATAILLPDGRTMQVVMRTLREAGESYVNPPMIAIADAIRGDIALYPGGVTTADMEYDERFGEVLRPITKERGGFPIGSEIAEMLKQDIRSGFFLDKIQLPETTRAMTATEVRRRIQEHIRGAAPISKPIQKDYNETLCDTAFQVLSMEGVFPFDEMPESLAGSDLEYKFRSPIDELAEQNDADLYVDVRDRILVPAAQLDPAVLETADLATATRDAMRAAGWKAVWFKPEEAVEARREEMAAEAEDQMMMQQIAQGGAAAEQAGRGMDALLQANAGAEMAVGGGQSAPAQPAARPQSRQPQRPQPKRAA